MKSFTKLLLKSLFSLLLLSVAACVTTRAQLHQERNNSAQVQEENTSPDTTVESKSSKSSASQANGGYSVEELKSMIAALSGRVEELEQKISKSANDHSGEIKKLQDRIDELEKKATAEPVVETNKSDRDEFQAGKEAYQAGKYDEAIEAFEEFLKNPKPEAQEEAIFLKGESHFKQKNFKKAIVEFSKFPEKFPKSNYNPKSLMRIAESFDGLGLKEDAKAFYTELIEKFPKSTEAKAAKKRISKKK